MADPYTLTKLTDVTEGVSLHRVKAGKRQPFGHVHDSAGEIIQGCWTD